MVGTLLLVTAGTIVALAATESPPPGPAAGVEPLPVVVDQPIEEVPLGSANGASGYVPWWTPIAQQPIQRRPSWLSINLQNALVGSLVHSARIKVVQDLPAIQETTVAEAYSQFDLHSFMESKFVDTSDPVGSSLTTGGPDRYLDQNWGYTGGVRRLGPSGAKLEASQKFGYEDSNSIYFLPEQQGTARLSLSLTQPLLNGAGQMYNTSTIVLAKIDTQVAQDRLVRDVQDILLEVQRSYWDLYLQRVLLLQKRKLYQQGKQIYDDLYGRREHDVVKSQLARAEAAVATRWAAVIRQEAMVLNAEAKLRSLVNDPGLGANGELELIPVEFPAEQPAPLSLQDSLVMALERRPEITLAMKEIRAAGLRLDVSKNELMPVLNLVLSSYVSGLQGDADFARAFEDQFGTGRPSYSAGLLFEYPLGNQGAQARLRKRQLELRQLANQLEATTAKVRYEVETSVREVDTSHREMASHYHAILAGEAEVEHLEKRWQRLPDQQAAGVVLDDLLNAQERLSRSEASYAGALVSFNVALVQLKRAMGTLFEYQPLGAGCRQAMPSAPSGGAVLREHVAGLTARRGAGEQPGAAASTIAAPSTRDRKSQTGIPQPQRRVLANPQPSGSPRSAMQQAMPLEKQSTMTPTPISEPAASVRQSPVEGIDSHRTSVTSSRFEEQNMRGPAPVFASGAAALPLPVLRANGVGGPTLVDPSRMENRSSGVTPLPPVEK